MELTGVVVSVGTYPKSFLRFRVNFRLEVYVPVKKSRVIQHRVRLVKVSPSKSIQQAKSTLLLLWFLLDLCPFLWDLGERCGRGLLRVEVVWGLCRLGSKFLWMLRIVLVISMVSWLAKPCYGVACNT